MAKVFGLGGRARRALAAGLVVTGIVTATAATTDEPVGAQVPTAPVTPRGMTVLLDSGAWSWFEDERAMANLVGNRLYVSAVTDAPTSGEVVVGEIDLATGARELVGLGAAELDDHNSAALWEAPNREVLTAWSRHHLDARIQTHRRRTDGSWLRLPPVTDDSRVTYNNLYSVLSEDGTALLYDFYRGSRFDAEAMVSNDGGRTWSALGRVIRDPADATSARPYVRYAARGDRIDFISTEDHPDRAGRTSVYHGFIRDGIVHASSGTPLGRVGTAIPVTSLTRIWQASSAEEAWTVDLTYDAGTGRPIAAISTTRSPDDHRYYVGRWDGASWSTRQIAYGGRALYADQPHYTGLVALDPRDANHVVISTDADPATGAPLVSASDGRRHWELFDGRRRLDGSYAWTPLTANSTVDNLRPIITTNASGVWALAWLRGRYTSYANYRLQVVGVVQRPNGSYVSTSAVAARRPVVAGIADPGPSSRAGVPLTGDFDGHPAGDVFLYRAGTARDDLVIGDDGRHPVHAQPATASGTYTPFTGDFDGDGDTDVFWYAPGMAADRLWLSQPDGTFATRSAPVVNGTYRPVAGDYDADGDTDILWYAPGRDPDYVWLTQPDRTFVTGTAPAVNGTYTPVPGDYDADGDTDILWYAPGTTADRVWTTEPGGTWTSGAAPAVNGTYTPVAGDYDGDADTDILWYAPGTRADHLWTTEAGNWSTAPSSRAVNGTYVPAAEDLDGNGADDVLWYDPGSATDHVWWSGPTPFAETAQLPLNL